MAEKRYCSYFDTDSDDTDGTHSDFDLDQYEGLEESDCDLSDEDEIDNNDDPLYMDENFGIEPNEHSDFDYSSLIWSSDIKPMHLMKKNVE